LVGSDGDVFVTRDAAELEAVVKDVLTPDLRCLVSVGGDGALHWALNAARPLAAERGLPLPVVLPTNGGTIDFVARRAGVAGRAETLLPRLVRALDRDQLATVELDSLDVSLAERGGAERQVLGFALAAGGIGQRFIDEYYRSDDPGPLTILSVIARGVGSLAVSGLPGPVGDELGAMGRRMFRPMPAEVRIDGARVPADQHGGIHVGAFDLNLGNVMRLFPEARAAGSLHMQAGAIRPIEMVRSLPALFSGGAIKSPTLHDGKGEVMEIAATTDEPLRPCLDGEIYEDVQRLAVRLGPRVRIARV
jgi:diacylglycerol kinase family enzyme